MDKEQSNKEGTEQIDMLGGDVKKLLGVKPSTVITSYGVNKVRYQTVLTTDQIMALSLANAS